MSAALTQRLRSLLRRKSSGSYGHIQNFQGVPFYEARPPWWAKFTWGFIAADLVVTCVLRLSFFSPGLFSHHHHHSSTMTELTWTKWTLPPEKPGDAPTRRPAWQRAGLCLAHLSLGVPAHHPCVGQRRAEAAPDSGCAPARSPRGRGAIFAHAHRPRARRIRGDIAHTGRAWALVDWAHTRAAARHDGACCALAGRVHGGVGDPEGVGG